MPDKKEEKGFWSLFRKPNSNCCGGLVIEEINEAKEGKKEKGSCCTWQVPEVKKKKQ